MDVDQVDCWISPSTAKPSVYTYCNWIVVCVRLRRTGCSRDDGRNPIHAQDEALGAERLIDVLVQILLLDSLFTWKRNQTDKQLRSFHGCRCWCSQRILKSSIVTVTQLRDFRESYITQSVDL